MELAKITEWSLYIIAIAHAEPAIVNLAEFWTLCLKQTLVYFRVVSI